METLKLYGTPMSHFTRKLRILLAEFGVAFDFVRTPGLLEATAAIYGENPLMRVPALIVNGETLIESDHIARYLVRRYDPDDRFGVRTEDLGALNRLAVANGIMSNEVVLLLAKRGGLQEIEGVAYFRKLMTALVSGLAWLEQHTDPEAPDLRYEDIALICMWQHVTHFQVVKDLDRYPRLAARVERFATRPSIASTTPEVSLLQAR
jgi:glutathione S-transferase